MTDRQAMIEAKKKRIADIKTKKLLEEQANRESQQSQISQFSSTEQSQTHDQQTSHTSLSPSKDNNNQFQSQQFQQQQQIPQPDLISLFLQQKRKKLGYCQVDIFDNKPQPKDPEIITIEFGIQCDIEQPKLNVQEEDALVLMADKPQRRESVKKRQSIDRSSEKPPVPQEKKITNEEINSIVQSQQFTQFFSRSSKIVEKAIETPEVDILEDLITTKQVVQEGVKDLITHSMSFFDPTYSDNRVVTSLEWSPNLPNTLLAAYSQNEDGAITDQVGVALLWSMQLKSRPEFYCFASSPITSACFHPFSPNVVLGGLYNGQVVIWDLRAKHTPEKRSTLNSGGHSYPIFSLKVVGSQNAHNLVSCSNDGRVCLWNLSMLNQPQKIIDLKTKSKQQQKEGLQEINATCLDFPIGDANNFYVGAEDGCLYKSKLHQNQNEHTVIPFEEHSAPVTGLSLNPSASPILSNLMLSSSFDWTVKLWNTRSQNEQKCIATFESSEDYVYDVQWNGVNPSLFSSVDGEGYVDLWDISSDLEAPIVRYKSGNNSINKSVWSKDGTRMAIGDSYGTVQILQLNQKALRFDNDKLIKLEQTLKSDVK